MLPFSIFNNLVFRLGRNKNPLFLPLFDFLAYFCRPKKGDLFRISHTAQKVPVCSGRQQGVTISSY
jgi:hypothetical protein